MTRKNQVLRRPWTRRDYLHAGAEEPVVFIDGLAPDGSRSEVAKTDAAHADLLLAAPDMLSLCERLLAWDHLDGAGDGPYWRRELEKVVARAGGKIFPRR